MAGNADVLQQAMLRRMLASGDGLLQPLRFRAEVVAKYRGIEGAQVIRTRTVGRVAIRGRWSLDMGIVDGASPAESEVQVTLADLLQRLPEGEREHWVAHLVTAPMSANYLQMKLSAGACIDDGETAAWT